MPGQTSLKKQLLLCPYMTHHELDSTYASAGTTLREQRVLVKGGMQFNTANN